MSELKKLTKKDKRILQLEKQNSELLSDIKVLINRDEDLLRTEQIKLKYNLYFSLCNEIWRGSRNKPTIPRFIVENHINLFKQ